MGVTKKGRRKQVMGEGRQEDPCCLMCPGSACRQDGGRGSEPDLLGQGAGLERGLFPSRTDNPGVNLQNDCGFRILAPVDRLESWAL